jgi:hypothetical protein
MTPTTQQFVDFHSVLAASGRSPEIADSADLYGWLCGSWELDVLHYRGTDVRDRALKGEVHAGWVLEGRAIQDVWIMPPRSNRSADTDNAMNMFGTTLRSWDPTIHAWRISWTNPVRGHHEDQIGRRNGTDIVQLGTRADGTQTRWTFTEITPDSFHWIGDARQPDGETWTREAEFRATRVRTRSTG